VSPQGLWEAVIWLQVLGCPLPCCLSSGKSSSIHGGCMWLGVPGCCCPQLW